MSIKFNTCHQARHAEDRIKASMYQNINKLAHKSRFAVILLSPFAAITSTTLTFTTRVALIGEAIFKGFGNILGCRFSDSCSFKRGVVQLFGSTAKHVCLLPFSVVAAAISLLAIPLILVFNSKNGSESLAKKHSDKVEERAEKKRLLTQLTQQLENRALHDNLLQEVGSDTKDIDSLLQLSHFVLASNREDRLTLAYHYNWVAADEGSIVAKKYCANAHYKGIGVEENKPLALEWYIDAFEQDQNDIEVAKKCGDIFSNHTQGIPADFSKAIAFYEHAANLNDVSCMVAAAEMHCAGGPHLAQDINKGIEWFERAAQAGDMYSINCLKQMQELPNGKDYSYTLTKETLNTLENQSLREQDVEKAPNEALKAQQLFNNLNDGGETTTESQSDT